MKHGFDAMLLRQLGPWPMINLLREGGALRELSRDAVASAVSTKAGLHLLNAIYDNAGLATKHRLYLLFAKIFSAQRGSVYPGSWQVTVPGGSIKLPFKPGSAWLDWDLALALLGNDQDVKQTYAAIISELRPDQFIDVGTNYGSHSLLMSTAGVPTISFEPNPDCIAYFREWAAANGIEPHIEAVALGDQEGEVHFDFPPKSTWLGMVSDADEAPEGYRRIKVPVRQLDDYLPQLTPGRLLIKLDAEGAEPAIIRGAGKVIAERRPTIIFECWNDREARSAIQEALGSRFAIYSLPWRPESKRLPIDAEAFLTDPATNFIATPMNAA